MKVWTEERVTLLVKWWGEEGMSANIIGDRLGISRNGVIGKAHRLGLSESTGVAWTDERVGVLKQAILDGLSGSQAAAKLGGTTRNAVLLKARRLGLQFKSGNGQMPKLKIAGKGAIFHEPSPRQPTVPYVERVEAPGSATIENIGAHMCRWPIGDPSSPAFTFCGQRQARGSYCAAHAERAYIKPPKTANEMARALRKHVA